MKKLIALVLALLMLGSVACAEDVNLSWDDVAEAANTIEGEFKTFDEISVKIWIPDVLKETELSDADREGGYSGDNYEEEIPVPMPNTEVKLLGAESTCELPCWEDRKLPDYFIFNLIV